MRNLLHTVLFRQLDIFAVLQVIRKYFPGSNCARGFNSGNNFTNKFDVSTRTTFDADASVIGVNAGGRHNFKFGYQHNRLFNTVDQGYADTGYVILYYGLSIDNELIELPDTNCGKSKVPVFFKDSGTVGEASSTNKAVFIQDQWTINNRLTLNLGLRLENEIVPSFGNADTTQAIEFRLGR